MEEPAFSGAATGVSLGLAHLLTIRTSIAGHCQLARLSRRVDLTPIFLDLIPALK
jgi:hypothetical protein